MSKILITGATGFVGTHLRKALAQIQHTVIAVDSSMGSIEKSETWSNFPEADIVIHLAAKTFVPDSWKQPDVFFQVNVNGTLNALEYCRKHNAKLIFLSSYLYGNPARLPIKEDDPIYTPNPYAFSKKTAEDLCTFYATAYNVPSVILRPFNIFGSGQSNSFLIPMLIDQVLIDQKIQVKDLEPKRDYIHVDDVVSAIIHSINISSSHIIHLGSGISYSVKEIIDINELAAYSKAKNVKIIAHHETSGSATNYERQMDTAFRFMLNHNQNAVKTGYVGKIIPRGEHHDGQWMVNHYVRVVEKAASYKIMVDAHEPVRPTGLYRTYPNWLACEAARGTEFNSFRLIGNPPEHETILPFTRWMGGPMDYTPGIFKQKLTQFDPNKKEMVHTTLAKQLAFYVVIFSPLQMAADLPENYEAHLDAFKFIEDVAVNWDDTKILEAEPGDYVTIARKAKDKDDWFVGGITDENGRTSTIDLSFLDANKKYEATIYRDADDAHFDTNPEVYVIEKKTVDSKTVLKLKEAPGGGYAISLKKL